MLIHLRPAVVLLALFTLLLGIAYPLAITGIAQTAFAWQANGSPLVRDGQTVGSDLIGQDFSSDIYFHPRPSAGGYDPMASGGSNLGPLSQKLKDRVQGSVIMTEVPGDAVTTSASGLDPHISPENAMMQVARVAAARGMTEEMLAALVLAQTEAPLAGVIGEPRVNVLRLNLALDKTAPR